MEYRPDFILEPQALWIRISVRFTRYDKAPIESLRWNNIPMKLRTKWDWYFRYRAALLQVKYPKAEVTFVWGAEKADGKTLEHILRGKVSSTQGNLTKHLNRIEAAREKFEKAHPIKGLFRIEDEPGWHKVGIKTQRLEYELKDAQNALKEYLESNQNEQL